jgi:hypothetical protein
LGSFKGTALAGSGSGGGAVQAFPVSSIYPFPNPWDVRTGASQVSFHNFSPGDTIKIFTLSGYLVKTLSGPSWDLTNDSGQSVASGLYFFLASDGTTTATGKLAVIR